MTSGVPGIAVRSLRIATEDRSVWAALLDEHEIDRANRFRLAADRDRFILGRGLLRTMLGAATGLAAASVSIHTDENGKPCMTDAGELAFNVSHSGDIVLVALGRARALGIDVERHRDDIDVSAVGRHVLTDEELAAISSATRSKRTALFFRQWVFKEALVKGLGSGLMRDPRRFQIIFENDTPFVTFVGQEDCDISSGWQLCSLSVESGYSAALAVLPSGRSERPSL